MSADPIDLAGMQLSQKTFEEYVKKTTDVFNASKKNMNDLLQFVLEMACHQAHATACVMRRLESIMVWMKAGDEKRRRWEPLMDKAVEEMKEEESWKEGNDEPV